MAGQRVKPQRLAESGHEFRHPRLADALAHLLGTATGPAGEPA
ncbi:DUF1731 domain-containing protein [Amycolatopsis kentuckyensis]|nr:DUF1731 domain-containing protein [Amycolatopsis kentuckyensis]